MHYAVWIIVLFGLLAVSWRYLGSYMAAVYEGRVHFLGWLERPTYRLLNLDPDKEQTWPRYAASLVVYSGVAVAVTYLIVRLQGHLPLNPQHLPAVTPALDLNTATSFVTNTNWQNYSGETTMSYLSQMGSLSVQMFASASAGLAVMIALIRGFSRKGSPTIGNFWADLVRGVYYILLPISVVAALVFIGEGAVQTFAGPVSVTDALNHFSTVVPRGPVGSMEAIKQLG
ncbi:MAG TPA: potassium-transporting ATPase subunit KdpA, partial [Acidimicrobiales bacterium]|nr:potassium-transporting ATPase subunit KdpA [Acidimicrobiales bacterium]